MDFNKKQKNKGFTIVELVIAIAILAIVGISITAFMLAGTNSYKRSNAEISLQYEGQMVTNQISDMIIDAAGDIDITDPSELHLITKKRTAHASSSDDADSFEYTEHIMKIVDEGNDWVTIKYYSAPATTKSGGGYTPNTPADSDFKTLAQYVRKTDGFNLDYHVNKDGFLDQLKTTIYFEYQGRHYTASDTVSLRNAQLLANIIPTAAGPEYKEEFSTGTTIEVKPKSAILAPGGTCQYKATVKGKGNVDQSVKFKIADSSPHKAGTTITADGLLKVADDEDAASLQIVATSVKYPTISGSAVAYIKSVTSVTVTCADEPIEQNDTFTLKALVTGKNIDSSPTSTDQSVRYTITEGAGFVTSAGGSKFHASAVAPVGTKVTITATSAIDPTKSGSWSCEIQKSTKVVDPEPTDPTAPKFTGWKDVIDRGDSGTFTVQNTGGAGISWVVEMVDGTGKVQKDGVAYTYSAGGNSCTVNVLKTFDFDKTGKIKVYAYYQTGEGKPMAATAVADVKRVSLKFKKPSGEAEGANIVDKKIYYLSPDKIWYYYELEGIVGDSVEWKKYDKKCLGINMKKKDSKIYLSIPDGSYVEKKAKSTKAYAYIDGHALGNYISVTCKKGNISYTDGAITYSYYFPTPDMDEFKLSKSAGSFAGAGAGGYYYWDSRCPYALINGAESTYVYYYYDTGSWDWQIGKNVSSWYIIICDGIYNDGNGQRFKTRYKWVEGYDDWVKQ